MKTLRRFGLMLVVLIMLCCTGPVVQAQSTQELRPIDMMLILDNSCSMFPEDRIISGCGQWGNDPDFLRIDGVELFVARLGFSEGNEADYQAGVVSLGLTSKLVAPLQPITGARDTIARLIADPEPELGTNIIDALGMAYRELRTSPNRRAANLPAVVLLTDGRPYPLAGQSDDNIESLVSANSDIPLFVMLLQDPNDAEYERYISFWEQMQARYDNVFAYSIQNRNQIEETYNKVVAQLQNTIPGGGGETVTPGNPYSFFVGQCVQQIVLTVLHQTDPQSGMVTVQDPSTSDVELTGTPGVHHFRGTDNSVEIIAIGPPRLADNLKNDYWTLTSDQEVRVHTDRRGAYSINFLEPNVSLTDIANVYLATDRQTPSREFALRFNLTDDCYGSEQQPIWGEVIYPDGKQESLRIFDSIVPDASGVYEIRFDFASAYPAVLDTPGRFTFILNAGSALAPNDTTSDRIPIAVARLLVDVGRGPYISDITPDPLICESGQPAALKIEIGDHTLASADSMRVRVFGAGTETALNTTSPGVFEGDVTDICTALISGLACSAEQETTLRARLTAQLLNGTPLQPTERDFPVRLLAPACPTPTPTPTPPPPPPPIPDTDGDGIRDPQDACPTRAGMALFDGCPPPWWAWLIAGLLAVGVLALFAFVLLPWMKMLILPPPKGYVLVCRSGKPEGPHNVYARGMAKRANRVTIGGDRKKAHIYVKNLEPVEFYIVKDGTDVKIFAAGKGGGMKGTFRPIPSDVSTSKSEIRLRIGLDNTKLKC